MSKRRRKQRIQQRIRQLVIMERRYAVVLRRLRKRMGKDMAKHGKNLVAMQMVVSGYGPTIEQLHRTWLRRVVEMFGREQFRYIEEIIQRAGKADYYEIFLQSVLLWIELRGVDMSVRIQKVAMNAARISLEESFTKGLGIEAVARELIRAVGGNLADATRIARTELHTAAGQGSDNAARSTGLDMVKEWGSTDDKRTRESHREADGQRREMNLPFDVGGSKLMYPGDPDGDADEVINCRCTAFYHPRINGVVFD